MQRTFTHEKSASCLSRKCIASETVIHAAVCFQIGGVDPCQSGEATGICNTPECIMLTYKLLAVPVLLNSRSFPVVVNSFKECLREWAAVSRLCDRRPLTRALCRVWLCFRDHYIIACKSSDAELRNSWETIQAAWRPWRIRSAED